MLEWRTFYKFPFKLGSVEYGEINNKESTTLNYEVKTAEYRFCIVAGFI